MRRVYAARPNANDRSTRTPAASEGPDPLRLERKTARADAADIGHATRAGRRRKRRSGIVRMAGIRRTTRRGRDVLKGTKTS
jgi:hypothetical protein